jgi:hypothetical protein
VIDIAIYVGLPLLALLLGYWIGRREVKRDRGLYVLFAVPRDDVDIDIPRPEDTRRMPC